MRPPQMIFISAGFDAHLEDDMGSLGLLRLIMPPVTRELVAMADKHAEGRIVSVLEARV